jgi:hypothetical protein
MIIFYKVIGYFFVLLSVLAFEAVLLAAGFFTDTAFFTGAFLTLSAAAFAGAFLGAAFAVTGFTSSVDLASATASAFGATFSRFLGACH